MKPFRCLPILAAGAMLSGAAHAHHPLDGAMPGTAVEGLLSGLAHPIIGPDHLLFLLAAATLLGLSRLSARQSTLALVLFATTSLVGTVLRVPGMALPLLQLLIGASLLAAAACLWRRRALSFGPALLLAAAAGGLLHGLAYGEAVIGAEAAPVVWYLLGLLVVQCGVLIAVFQAVRHAARLGSKRLRLGVGLLSVAVGATGTGVMGLALLT
jgi:urease accessory protein